MREDENRALIGTARSVPDLKTYLAKLDTYQALAARRKPFHEKPGQRVDDMASADAELQSIIGRYISFIAMVAIISFFTTGILVFLLRVLG